MSVLPLWTVWNGENEEFKSVEKSCLKNSYEKYSDYIVDGHSLVPHDESYFYDGLHPNDKGFEFYGNNLAKELRCILVKQ